MRGSALLVTLMMALAAIVSTSPVELEKRQRFPFGEVLLASYSYDSATTKFSGFLWVKNIAFQKIVQVYYSDPKVIWSPTQSVNAVYLAGPDPRGYEYWTFSAENVPNFGPGSVFYLRYAVAGQVFFDNNEFRNYVISGGDTVITTAPVTSTLGPPFTTTPGIPTTPSISTPTLAPPPTKTVTSTPTTAIPSPAATTTIVNPAPPVASNFPVQLQQYSYAAGVLSGRIWIRNIAFNKVINVIASTTSGRWGIPATAFYISGPSANNYELWGFSANLPGVGHDSAFYIRYDVAGQTFYDNNGGPDRNFRIVSPAISPPSTKGFSDDITSWLTNSFSALKTNLFSNISPAGTLPGMVVAAPKIQPPRPPGEPVPQSYFYHWTRDAALVMDLVNELYKNGDATVEDKLWEYAALSRKLQGVPALTGLGEPRFEVSDGRGNTDQWCRPQQDGPALRASGLIRFAKAYLANGGSLSRVISLYNSTSLGVIKPDLDYTSLNSSVVSGCDLWEENTGLHFFTQMVDRRALKEGAEFALFLGDTAFAKVCSDAAAALDTQVLKYWNAQLKTLTTTVDSTKYLDAAIVLGVIHGYNGDGVYSPADDKVLNTVYQLSLGFIAEYPLNYKNRTDAAGRPLGVALGRYFGDRYNGVSSAVPNLSSPWYLTTAAVAELYYRAASQYLLVGSLTVTELNRPFFISPRPAGLQIGDIALGTYTKASPEFSAVIGGLQSLGDEYMRRVIVHGDSGVKFGEQFDRENGKANAKGAAELTWSFAAILTASEAREDLRRLLV